MSGILKKASFFQGIGANPLFAQEEQVFLREKFMQLIIEIKNPFMQQSSIAYISLDC